MTHETYQDAEPGYNSDKEKEDYLKEYQRIESKATEIVETMDYLNEQEKRFWIKGFTEGYFYNK